MSMRRWEYLKHNLSIYFVFVMKNYSAQGDLPDVQVWWNFSPFWCVPQCIKSFDLKILCKLWTFAKAELVACAINYKEINVCLSLIPMLCYLFTLSLLGAHCIKETYYKKSCSTHNVRMPHKEFCVGRHTWYTYVNGTGPWEKNEGPKTIVWLF